MISRSDLGRLVPLDGPVPAKTFVLEVHNDDPITDLPGFCEELFSARAPFRLWGRPEVIGDSAIVEAVDLHVGQRLGMEIGRDWMRIYLTAGSCGNTVARLVSNLQVGFDSALTFSQPGLQEATALQPVPG